MNKFFAYLLVVVTAVAIITVLIMGYYYNKEMRREYVDSLPPTEEMLVQVYTSQSLKNPETGKPMQYIKLSWTSGRGIPRTTVLRESDRVEGFPTLFKDLLGYDGQKYTLPETSYPVVAK